MSDKQRLIILTGPTAVGKSRLSIELAKTLSGEIISADSMQVYKHMDIGTDKVSMEKRREVKHHLIDVCEPTDSFDVTVFQRLAKEAIRDIASRGHLPIIVGGTGFYIQAVLYDIDFTETDEDDSVRKRLEETAAGPEGARLLFEKLSQVDPKSARLIPMQNLKRVIRALEFYEKTKRPISAHNEEQRAKTSPYDFRYYVLTDERSRLYERIDKRVEEMMAKGLVEEVKRLKDMGVTDSCTSMQGLGYREILAYLNGEYDLERAVYLIKRNTRHFAKRQLTWFRREREVILLDKQNCADECQILQTLINGSSL